MRKLFYVGMILLLFVLVGCAGESSSESKNESESIDETHESDNNDSSEGSKEVKVMKIGSVDTADRPMAQGMFHFKELVEKETNGAIEVQVFPDSQLGGERDIFEGLQLGTVQAATIDTGTISNFSPRFTIWSLPFLFKDRETAHSVLDGPIGEELFEDLPEIGVVGLSYWESGYRNLTNSVKEVKVPDDVKGLKLRTMENEMDLEVWTKFGAIPTPMAFPELYASLQQGVVDGQENPLSVIATNNFFEIQDHLTITNHKYSTNPLLISKEFWDTLTDEEQEILRKAAEETRVFERDLNQTVSDEYYQTLLDNGMEIAELTPEERQQWIDKVQPVYEDYRDKIGADLVDRLLEEVK